jgi:hypothetical protein
VDPVRLSELLNKIGNADTPEAAAELLAPLTAGELAEVKTALAETATQIASKVKAGEPVEVDDKPLTPKDALDIAKAAKANIAVVDGRLDELAKDEADLAAEVDSVLDGLDIEPKVEAPPEVKPEEAPAPAPAAEAPAETPVDAEPEPIAASAKPKPVKADLGNIRRNQRPQPQPEPTGPVTVLTAAGNLDSQGISAGRAFPTAKALGEAMAEAGRALPAGGGKIKVAQARFGHELPDVPDNPEEAFLFLKNIARQAERGEDVLVASGGFCAPSMPVYDFFNIGARDGLLQLPTVNSERGSITYPVSPGVADLLAQDGIADQWTNATDITPGEDTKAVFTPACVETLACEVAAYPTRLQFGNFQQIFYPEFVAHMTSESLITHDHKVDIALLAALSALVTESQVAGDTGGGTFIQVSQTLAWFSVWYRNKWRTARDLRLTTLVPVWLWEALVADVWARRDATDKTRATAEVLSMFDQLNLDVQFLHNLNPIGTNPGGRFDPADVYMFAPGTVVRQTRGRLDLGVTRDSTLNSTNDFQTFVETFDGLCRPGNEILKINNVVACPTGGVGAEDTVTCPTTS